MVNGKTAPNLEVEYAEVCNNIRECWRYTTELLRHFLVMQVILISILGIGGNAVNIASITSAAKKAGKSTAATSSLPISAEISILALITIAAVLALGARLQNSRLFFNAKVFISRAAFLEGHGKFSYDESSQTKPPNIYMRDRLGSEEVTFDMEGALRALYTAIMVFWIAAFFFILFTFLQS